MPVRISIVLLSALLLLLTGCTEMGAPATPSPAAAPNTGSTAAAETSSPDKATLAGQVVSNANQAPIKQTVVQLAQVYHDAKTNQAVYALDIARAPGTWTDDRGFFTFTNLEPGEYVLVVGSYYGVNDIVREQNGDARIFTTEAGKTQNTGVVQVRPDVSPGK